MSKEWAIRDEATGEWYCSDHKWRANVVRVGPESIITGSYCGVASAGRFAFGTMAEKTYRDGARIVPAPPREMTDAEAEEWFTTLNGTYSIAYNESGNFFVRGVRDENLGSGNAEWLSRGHSIYDAIRSARRKLESK